ncbi:MAG TPA: metallophosphoesterase family protein [Candidatus Hydrogenedentes bacterium]|nr:metallophosphoesterase family protein [Candidatus Hydrogenedentota bacterium]
MYLAVFCAIRGNFPALQAILEAVDERGIEMVFNAGNCVGRYPWPNEVIQLLRAHKLPTVQGADDRAVARFLRSSDRLMRKIPENARRGLEWTHAHTASANLEWLGTLPREQRCTLENIDILLCPGAPTGTKERLDGDSAPEVFERQRESARARLILCGGAETPFARQVQDTLFVCPGAADGVDGARYAIVDTESEPWSAAFHVAPYDAALVARAAGDAGL